MGPHGDCGSRDVVSRRLLAGGFVQLFYLSALHFLRRWCLFDFRLLLAVLDQEVFFVFFGQLPYRQDPYCTEVATHAVVVPDAIEPSANSTCRCVEFNENAASQAVSPAPQYNVVTTATGGIDNEILLIQNGVSSDTWLMDAIVGPGCAVPRGRLIVLWSTGAGY